ncbi:MAG: type I glyceraldehyde-3-phosphate dehydrogenase [Acidobacteria bacterium CG_4_9_14_3_um_filter_49_7]|nr:MAG: type I glyceraldehyde-3-phosphate dehydrogenase [Acidobacteria bacterium CG_4_9_14_3_um_filter_49_7]
MSVRLAINGFGRIGRMVFRAIHSDPTCGIEVVAINDLMDNITLAHLLQYDSVHGKFSAKVTASDEGITVDGKLVPVTATRNLDELNWGKFNAYVVLESTGLFRTRDKVSKHLAAGAKKVVISAPAKSADVQTVVLGVNDKAIDLDSFDILSNASCTTNCLAPVVKVIDDNFRVKHGLLTTIHSYTNDQRILDLPHSDLRRARAAALSMIPTSTGAAKAVGLVLPHLAGKLDGLAVRVPTPNVSLVDVVFTVGKATDTASVRRVLKEAADGELNGILGYSEDPLVSCDYNTNPLSSTVDAEFTQVIEGNMVKVLSWYDNEMGYSSRCKDLIARIG